MTNIAGLNVKSKCHSPCRTSYTSDLLVLQIFYCSYNFFFNLTRQSSLTIFLFIHFICIYFKSIWGHSGGVWHAKVIFIQLSKYQATFKISFNFVKDIAQLSKYGTTFRNISHSSGRVYIFGNMYNELRKVMGVVTWSSTFSGEGRW